MRKTKGFTLIELLIVVVILGILAVFVFLTLGGALKKPKDARAKTAITELSKAVEQYKAINEGAVTGLPNITDGANATQVSTFKTALVNAGVMSFQSPTLIDAQNLGVKFTVTGAATGKYKITGRSTASTVKCWVMESLDGLSVQNNYNTTDGGPC